MCRPGALQLLKVGEQSGNIGVSYSRTRVLDFDAKRLGAISQSTHLNAAAFRCKLDRIRQVVIDHLLQPCAVGNHLGNSLANLHVNGNFLFIRENAQHITNFMKYRRDVNCFRPKFHLSRFDFGDIQNIIHQLK